MSQEQNKNKPDQDKPGNQFGSGSGGGGDQNALVSHGPYAENLPVGGMTVSAIRKKYADRFDIDPKAEPVVDGSPVDDDTIIQAGQTLMFIRRAGEKGLA
jgi:hypothetical protein